MHQLRDQHRHKQVSQIIGLYAHTRIANTHSVSPFASHTHILQKLAQLDDIFTPLEDLGAGAGCHVSTKAKSITSIESIKWFAEYNNLPDDAYYS